MKVKFNHNNFFLLCIKIYTQKLFLYLIAGIVVVISVIMPIVIWYKREED